MRCWMLLAILACAGGAVVAQDAPFGDLTGDAGQAAYCFFAKSQQLQMLAGSRDPLQALQQVKVLQNWEATTNGLLPERDARNRQLAAAMSLFAKQVEQVEQAGGGAEEAKARVVEAAMPACERLMARDDLAPQFAQAAPAPAVRENPTPEPAPPVFRERPSGTPFGKGVFAPGWRGDLDWLTGGAPERVTVTSHDTLPTARDAPEIHFTMRVFGSNARTHCIGSLIESGVSADGLTLLARPAPGNQCGVQRVVRVRALAPDRIRIDIEDAGSQVAFGEFTPVSAAAWLPESASLAALNVTPERVESPAATPAPVAAIAVKSASAAAKPGGVTPIPALAPQGMDCATCLPTDSAATAGEDLFAPLFVKPLEGRFYWDWHDSEYSNVRTQGQLKRLSAEGDPLSFELSFESNITVLCVGTLRESGRSLDGFLLHLRVADGEGANCEPRVTHGYLLPYITGGEQPVASLLSLRLFDAADRMVTNALLRSTALEAMQIDLAKASRAKDVVRAMEADASERRKNRRLTDFQRSAEYPRLAPFYDACMNAADNILGVVGSAPYCLCMTQKFGTGERIPSAEFASYAQDFSRLVARFSGPHTDANKLYVRLDETCKTCSDSRYELEPYCAGRDTLLYAATDYVQMIRLLDKQEPIVESTDYYKKVFFRTYLQGFSLFCQDQVTDPVRFDYIVKEYEIGDPWADPEGRVTQHDTTYVTSRYAGRYERFRDELNKVEPGQIGNAIAGAAISSEAQLRRQISDVKSMIAIEAENRRAIRDHLKGQCSSPSVRRVYANLDGLIR